MKACMEIVTGFIGSGKTTFINELLNLTLISEEKVLIIQCEKGSKDIEESIKNKDNVIIKKFNNKNKLTISNLSYMINLYSPHRIIIEHNGSKKLEEIFNMHKDKRVSSLSKISTIYHIADAMTFNLLISNTGGIVYDQVFNSDMVVLNNTSYLSKENVKGILENLSKLNNIAEVINLSNIKDMRNTLHKAKILDNGMIKKFKIYLSYKELNMIKKISSRV